MKESEVKFGYYLGLRLLGIVGRGLGFIDFVDSGCVFWVMDLWGLLAIFLFRFC